MSKNILIEAQKLISQEPPSLRIGIVTTLRRDGGWEITTSKGGTNVVFGDAEEGAHVLYDSDNIIVGQVKREAVKTYVIT